MPSSPTRDRILARPRRSFARRVPLFPTAPSALFRRGRLFRTPRGRLPWRPTASSSSSGCRRPGFLNRTFIPGGPPPESSGSLARWQQRGRIMTKNTFSRLSASLLLLLLPGLGAGQQPPTFTEEVQVRVMDLDVAVTDKSGRPVTDLRR